MLPERIGFHRTPEVVCSCPLPAPLQTVRKSTASDLCSSNRTNRGAIRPHRNRNEPGVRKDVTNHKTFSSLSSGLNTPLFCIPCIEAGYAKNSRCFHRSPRLSYRLERSWQRTGTNHLWRPVKANPFWQHPILT